LRSSAEAVKWGLERCRACGLIFTNPRPSDAVLNAFYSTPGYKPHEGGLSQSSATAYLLSRIEHHHPGLNTSGEFLDFGCGGGALLREAARLGWQVYGYDVSPRAIEACQANGLAVQGDISQIPSPIDAIFMCHSLEHVSDFNGTLTAVVRALKPDTGRLFIAVPNARSLRAILSPQVLSRYAGVNERYAAFPIHLSHFTARSLIQLMASYGLECTALETYAFGIDSYFRSWDDTGSTESASSVVKQSRKSAIKQLVKSAFFGAGLGDNLLGIFRRRP
jgi:SAM-dependent methyltransferase